MTLSSSGMCGDSVVTRRSQRSQVECGRVHHAVRPHIQGQNALLTHALGGPATSSSYGSQPGPDICASPRSGERRIEIEFDNP
jgi:hypothetical protein